MCASNSARAGVDALVDRPHAVRVAQRADVVLARCPRARRAGDRRSPSAWRAAATPARSPARQRRERAPRALDDLREVAQEPRIDPASARRAPRPEPPRRSASATAQGRSGRGTSICAHSASIALGAVRQRRRLEARVPDLERAERLLEALLEGAADRHHLADRLHLRGERRCRACGNFSKVKRGIFVTT